MNVLAYDVMWIQPSEKTTKGFDFGVQWRVFGLFVDLHEELLLFLFLFFLLLLNTEIS